MGKFRVPPATNHHGNFPTGWPGALRSERLSEIRQALLALPTALGFTGMAAKTVCGHRPWRHWNTSLSMAGIEWPTSDLYPVTKYIDPCIRNCSVTCLMFQIQFGFPSMPRQGIILSGTRPGRRWQTQTNIALLARFQILVNPLLLTRCCWCLNHQGSIITSKRS